MRTALFLVIGSVLAACGARAAGDSGADHSERVTASFRVIDGRVGPDTALLAELSPYRTQVAATVAEVLAVAPERLVKARPESALGALASDAILAAARQRSDHPVQMAMLNHGGLRAPIAAGDVTMGAIYELMPFENAVSVLQLTGTKVLELADQIASRGGEPIAGFSFVIDGPDGGARDVLVDGSPVQPDARYWLATADFIANGGGGFSALADPLAREDFDHLVRDAIIEYVREVKRLPTRAPDRIRVGGTP